MSIMLFNPNTLHSAYALAKMQKVLWAKTSSFVWEGKNQNGGSRIQSLVVMARTMMNSNMNQNSPKPGILALLGSSKMSFNSRSPRRMSSKEIEERKQKGLCF